MSEQQPDYRAVAAKIRAAGVAVEAQMTALRKENAALRAELSRLQAGGQGVEPIGEVGTMPGTSGFTMACFHADKVPVGTKLYTTPPAAVSAEGVPQGLKLVPVEATPAMRFALESDRPAEVRWASALAAAPAAPVQAGQWVGVDMKRLVAFAKLFFSEGFYGPRTYNDTVLNSPDEAWADGKLDDAYVKRQWGEAAIAASKEKHHG